jgi:hypothetical protein
VVTDSQALSADAPFLTAIDARHAYGTIATITLNDQWQAHAQCCGDEAGSLTEQFD